MKKNNKKGFTLAELLVVVAIIAVLVAIAIPTFGAATEKAAKSVELANARATYGEGMVNYISGEGNETIQTYDGKTYTFTYDTDTKTWSVSVTPVGSAHVYNQTYTQADFDNAG